MQWLNIVTDGGQNIFVATWNKLYRTDFLRKNEVRCIPHYLIDDPWFTYQVILRARSCRLLPDCTLFFTYNPSIGHQFERAARVFRVFDRTIYWYAVVEVWVYTLFDRRVFL